MYENDTLAASGEQLMDLDEDVLSAIAAGDGPLSKIAQGIIDLLWGCIKTGLDDVIDAAEEGYADARA